MLVLCISFAIYTYIRTCIMLVMLFLREWDKQVTGDGDCTDYIYHSRALVTIVACK